MALWSGATLYERHLRGKRELWIPKGFTEADLLYCWKVKLDPATGRHFFVNLAGFGKAWRLPDIYDPQTQERIRRFAERDANGASSGPAPPPQTGEQPGQMGNTSAASRVHPTPLLPPENHTVPRQRDASPWSSARDVTNAGSNLDDVPPPQDECTEEDEWSGPPPPSSAASSRPARSGADGANGAMNLLQPESLDVAAAEMASQETQQAAAALEEAYLAHSAAQRQRLDSLTRSQAALESERRLRDARYEQEMRELDALEQQQAAQMAAEAEHVRQRASRSHSPQQTPRMSGHADADPQENSYLSPWAVTPHTGTRDGGGAGGAHMSAPPSSSVPSAAAAADAATARALVIAMEQLDHERARSAKLATKLEERDRLLLEHALADAERERREIALRIRMVEALAAYRNEHALEEQLEDERREAAILDARLGGRQGERLALLMDSHYIPDHPLRDAASS